MKILFFSKLKYIFLLLWKMLKITSKIFGENICFFFFGSTKKEFFLEF